jgi:hypothetical protein
MRSYEPNDFDRQLVSEMALYCSREKIAAHIINERTKRAINRKTLEKHYRKELEGAKVEITNDAIKSWRDLIREKHWPATYLALRNGGVIADEKDSSATSVSLKWTIHGVSPDGNKVEPITLEPSQYRAIAPPTAPQPSEPPPAYTGRTISSDDEDGVKPLFEAVEPRPDKPDFRRKHEFPPDFAPWPAETNPHSAIPKQQGPYRTELDDPAVIEANKPFHRKKITTYDPGVVQRRGAAIAFHDRWCRLNERDKKTDE